MYYTYVLRSLKDRKLYIGSTNDLKRRLKEHNDGECESTKHRRPFELVYYEAYRSESDARTREHQLKNFAGSYTQLKKRLRHSLSEFSNEGLPLTRESEKKEKI